MIHTTPGQSVIGADIKGIPLCCPRCRNVLAANYACASRGITFPAAGKRPILSLAWAWEYFWMSFVNQRGPVRKLLRGMSRLTTFWIPWLDRWLVRRLGSYDAASGFYFMGMKAPQPSVTAICWPNFVAHASPAALPCIPLCGPLSL